MEKVERKKNTPYVIIVGILLVIMLIAIFLFFGLKGETKTSDETMENEKSESVICTIKGLDYPFFSYNKSINENTKITMVFNGKKLGSIYLMHEMLYDNDEIAAVSSTQNHADMNKSFGNTYGADAFNANYHVGDNKMRMSLYTEAKKLDEDAKKYFLATSVDNNKNSLIKNYERQGFTCENNTN